MRRGRGARTGALLLVLLALAAAAWVWRTPPRTHTRTRTVVQPVWRLRDVHSFLASRRERPLGALSAPAPGAWERVDATFPNVSDLHTLRTLAHMATQAYYATPAAIPDAPEWSWAHGFGWEDEGLRGHVFRMDDARVVVVALKGTSASFLPGGQTGQRDKENDNLLFSCCCARVGSDWTPVCGCADDAHRCDSACVSRALLERSLYYPAATDLYNNLSYQFPNSQVWITGHSLGGVLASFLGMTFGVPAVAFESPGDRLAAQRLHLPLPPGSWSDEEAFAVAPVTHVYNTADSLATGQCQGPLSLCGRTGFAMETRCHAGQSIVYDTTRYLGWSVGVLAHRITQVITALLTEDWEARARRAGRAPADGLGAVPKPARETLCQDCNNWQFT